MPSINARELERCLRTKLRAVERKAGDHRVFEVYDEAGALVATTALSRSWRGTTTIGANMAATIGRELGLRREPGAFEQLVRCPLDRAAYLALVAAETQA